MRMNKAWGFFVVGSLLAAAAPACSPEGTREDSLAAQGALVQGGANEQKPSLNAPEISIVGATQTTIDVQVCGGDMGAPAGFSVQWMTADAFNAGGFSETSATYCAASFSGVPAQSVFSLDPGECAIVTIGALDPAQVGVSFHDGCNAGLTCGTEYMFRAFSHGNADFGRSPFTTPTAGSTLPCDEEEGGGCTFTQGYWKTHDGSPNADVWPVDSLTLGAVSYSQEELSLIFDTAVKGNGLTALAHQLTAAKLNIANGADASAICDSVAAADALIGGLVVPAVGSGYLSSASTSALVDDLASFNEGTTGPGHCE